LIEIDAVIRGNDFNAWRLAFVAKHVGSFSYEDENKLEYTEIHNSYEEQIEKRIAEGLPELFDLGDFMKSLPDFLEGPGGKDDGVGASITLLLEVSDFQQFKAMMLFARREKDEAESKHADELLDGKATSAAQTEVSEATAALAGLDVEGMMHMCEELAQAGANGGGSWTNLLTLDWMAIDRMPVPADRRKKSSEIYLRGVWTLNLTYAEACDMMFTMGPRRKTWDPNFTSVTFPNGGSDRDDDVVTSVALNFGYLINLAMFGSGAGTQLVARNFRRWSNDMVIYAMVPWDVKANRIDANHALLSLKTGTIAPHPTLPGKVVMTSLETNSMGGMPQWALHFMVRATAPSMMRALESRYIIAARNTGTTVDVTPGGSRPEGPSLAAGAKQSASRGSAEDKGAEDKGAEDSKFSHK
jgi:hypothetical protein